MEATLLDLSRRVERLEQEFNVWRIERNRFRDISSDKIVHPLSLAEQGRIMMERAKRNAIRDSLHFRQVMKEMGIMDGPVLSRKELQRLYVEAGFDPEANDFAQGIVAMREE